MLMMALAMATAIGQPVQIDDVVPASAVAAPPPPVLPRPPIIVPPTKIPPIELKGKARRAVPIDPGNWIGESDYPDALRRWDIEGVTAFRLEISANGDVMTCYPTRSTVDAETDAHACKLIKERAKFKPARSPKGKPAADVFESRIRWTLPG